MSYSAFLKHDSHGKACLLYTTYSGDIRCYVSKVQTTFTCLNIIDHKSHYILYVFICKSGITLRGHFNCTFLCVTLRNPTILLFCIDLQPPSRFFPFQDSHDTYMADDFIRNSDINCYVLSKVQITFTCLYIIDHKHVFVILFKMAKVPLLSVEGQFHCNFLCVALRNPTTLLFLYVLICNSPLCITTF